LLALLAKLPLALWAKLPARPVGETPARPVGETPARPVGALSLAPPLATSVSSNTELLQHPRERLGDIIVAMGFAERTQVEAVISQASNSNEPIGRVLLASGLISCDQLASALARRFGLEYMTVDDIVITQDVSKLITPTFARRSRAIPVAVEDNTLLVALTNPQNYPVLDDIGMMTGLSTRPVVVSEDDMDVLIKRLGVLHGDINENLFDEIEVESTPLGLGEAAESENDAPTIKLVRSIITDAVERDASDIHFVPDEGGLQIRYRIDGVMAEAAHVPRSQALAVISRIKILSDLDISEKRIPQDGRIGITLDERRIDIRVAVIPLVDGESAVLRILDAGRKPLSLDDLGMNADDLERLAKPLRATHGAILSTGPTGSGKTTSLYAIISLIRTPEQTLTTIEDPVEYRLPGVNQIQVNERVGLTFETGLKAIVRADPDVIMVGEIRDHASAHMAVDAALTGHLVLSTLHTNDAPSAAMRLVEMGVEPYLVASAINCIIAQRLARKLCPSCRVATDIPGALLDREEEVVAVYESSPKGCGRCRHTGYRGRLALFEVMVVTAELRRAIIARASTDEINDLAVAQGMRTLRDDGYEKVLSGMTSLAEIGRVLG
jgi:type IV pilus assembly protein PilB